MFTEVQNDIELFILVEWDTNGGFEKDPLLYFK